MLKHEAYQSLLMDIFYYNYHYKTLYLANHAQVTPMFGKEHILDVYGNNIFGDQFEYEVYLGSGNMFANDGKVGALYNMSGEFLRKLWDVDKETGARVSEYVDGLAYFKSYITVYNDADSKHYRTRDYYFNEMIDVNGQTVFKIPDDREVNEFNKNFMILQDYDRNKQIMKYDGTLLTPNTYDYCFILDSDVIKVEKGDERGLLHLDGTYVDLTKYNSDVVHYNEGLLRVNIKGKTGFINKFGEVVIPLIYDVTQYTFSEGLVGVKKNKREYYIDKNNNIVLEIKHPYHIPFTSGGFNDGIAEINHTDDRGFIDQGVGYINLNGDLVLGLFKTYKTNPYNRGYAVLDPTYGKMDMVWTTIDIFGNEVCVYDYYGKVR